VTFAQVQVLISRIAMPIYSMVAFG